MTTCNWKYKTDYDDCQEREIMIVAGTCDCLPVRDGAKDLNSFNGSHLSLGELTEKMLLVRPPMDLFQILVPFGSMAAIHRENPQLI